jgi:hypothetical protein
VKGGVERRAFYWSTKPDWSRSGISHWPETTGKLLLAGLAGLVMLSSCSRPIIQSSRPVQCWCCPHRVSCTCSSCIPAKTGLITPHHSSSEMMARPKRGRVYRCRSGRLAWGFPTPVPISHHTSCLEHAYYCVSLDGVPSTIDSTSGWAMSWAARQASGLVMAHPMRVVDGPRQLDNLCPDAPCEPSSHYCHLPKPLSPSQHGCDCSALANSILPRRNGSWLRAANRAAPSPRHQSCHLPWPLFHLASECASASSTPPSLLPSPYV